MSDDTRVSAPVGLWRRFAAPFGRRDLMEALLVGVGFLLYFAVRGAVIDRPATAYFHALDVIDLQRRLGFFWEDDLNGWTKDRLFWAQTMNIIYFWLHFPLIVVFGIWLYYFRRHKYTLMRDAFLSSGAIALVIYWSYPVAPPRELPELAARFDPEAPAYVRGFLDTMQQYLGYASLLAFLRRWNAYGYQLVQELARAGLPAFDSTTVYRTLRQLERTGLVSSFWDTSESGPARRMYSLTKTGETFLNLWLDLFGRYQNILHSALDSLDNLDRSPGGDQPPQQEPPRSRKRGRHA